MKILTGVKIAVFAVLALGVIGIFVFNPSLGAIAGCVLSGIWASLSRRQDVSSDRSPSKQVGDGLSDDKKRVGDLNERERKTQAGLDRQAESLGRASDAVEDAERTLAEIAKQNSGK